MSGTFDVNGLAEVMNEQIAHRNNSDTINLLWAGYLAALAVQGSLTDREYHDLNASLKDVGRDELRELLTGYAGQFE